jgi:hypothetical protein
LHRARAILSLIVLVVSLWSTGASAQRARVLPPSASAALVAALGYREGLPAGESGWLVADITLAQGEVLVDLRTPAGGERARLRATHEHNAPAAALTIDGIAFDAEGGELARLEAAARWLAPALSALPWRPLRAWGHAPPLAPTLLVWGALLILLITAAPGLLRAWRRAPSDLRAALTALTALAAGLRLALARPWPISFVEIERLPQSAKPAHMAYAALAAPFDAWSADPLWVQSLVGFVLSVAMAPLTVALGHRWGLRGGAWVAGVLLALLPLQLRFAFTSSASVGIGAFLLVAVLATEGLARAPAGRRVRPGLMAGLAWALLFHLRPETPGLALIPLAWVVADPRLRAAARSWTAGLSFGGPLLGSLGLAALQLFIDRPAPTVAAPPIRDWAGDAWRAAETLWDLVLDPAFHPPVIVALALVGVIVLRGRARAVAVFAALLFPALVFHAPGASPVSEGATTGNNLRYALYGQPFLALLAGGGLWWLVGHAWAVARVGGRLAMALALLTPLVYLAFIRLPAPLQAEQRFLARQIEALPPDAVLIVRDDPRREVFPLEQVRYRLAAAGRLALSTELGAGAGGGGIRVLAEQEVDPSRLRGVQAFTLRGWFEFLEAARPGGVTPPRVLDGAPLACEAPRVVRHPGRSSAPMRLCLSRVEHK